MSLTPPLSKIGNKVEFSTTTGTPLANKGIRSGAIVDEVWTGVYLGNNSVNYVYTSQLIRWADGSRSIRMAYYFWTAAAKRWQFGRFAPEDKPSIIQELIRKTLKKCWK
jgi:hypothetical protein